MELPQPFIERMKRLLQDEYEEFIRVYADEKVQGLRINPLKGNPDRIFQQLPFKLEKIPWATHGYYFEEPDRPGKHAYHEAGLYYIQEPSAMAVGELVAAEPGEWVLDLCAAPGGKTTHLAAQMGEKGLLVTNDIHLVRAKSLVANVERMGITNALVLNETSQRLAERFPNAFDRVLVDAPCSGEGMFRKHEAAIETWSERKVAACSNLQMEILKEAAKMVKPGGRLVYSTCTFSPEENEQVIEWFLGHYDFEVEDLSPDPGFDRGRLEWTLCQTDAVRHTFRLWPHRLKGEGHYIAVLRKTGEEGEPFAFSPVETMAIEDTAVKLYEAFAKAYVVNFPEDRLFIKGSGIYYLPEDIPSIHQLNVLRAGVQLGTIKKNRFEPSYGFAHILKPNDVKQCINFSASDEDVYRYLQGEPLTIDKGFSGWVLVCVDGYPLGWGKASQGSLKNHYPKGLRWL